MIVVFDTAEERSIYTINANIILTTINCDGIYRYWGADSMGDLVKWWWEEDYDGPASEDEVVEFIVNGENETANAKVFYDIVTFYGFEAGRNKKDVKHSGGGKAAKKRVYLYKQFCDGYAYGEEDIKVFRNRDEALRQMHKDLADFFKLGSFEQVKEKLEKDMTDMDTLKEDYVSFEGNDGYMFWIVEEKEVMG